MVYTKKLQSKEKRIRKTLQRIQKNKKLYDDE